MEQKRLILLISGKTETEVASIISAITIIINNPNICIESIDNVSTKTFDWNAEVVIKTSPDEEYKTTSNELYEKLISDISRFSDWEYKFISDMYRKAIEDETYSDGQKKWIDKLRNKYL
jgi:MinD-like ATPase involved in chromosome partitioning or flagellar assembly